MGWTKIAAIAIAVATANQAFALDWNSSKAELKLNLMNLGLSFSQIEGIELAGMQYTVEKLCGSDLQSVPFEVFFRKMAASRNIPYEIMADKATVFAAINIVHFEDNTDDRLTLCRMAENSKPQKGKRPPEPPLMLTPKR
jgi:hypothetical protein